MADEATQAAPSISSTLTSKKSSINYCMTAKLRAVLDQRMPGHPYTSHVPSHILLDSALGLNNLHDTLRGTKLYFPSKPTPPINEEYQAKMRALKDRLEEQEYQSMVHSPVDSSLASSQTELRELKNQVSTIVNVLISIFTAAMASWYWTPHWRPASRVLAAFGSAAGLGLIETFLYLRYLSKIEMNKAHDGAQKGKLGTRKRVESNEKIMTSKKNQ